VAKWWSRHQILPHSGEQIQSSGEAIEDGKILEEERFDEKGRLIYWHRDGETFLAQHNDQIILLYPEGKIEEAVSLPHEEFKELFVQPP